jgi:N-acetylneuraminate synthase
MHESIEIGSKFKPFIIAEMSGNHNQSLEKALQIVDAVAEAGVDALKIQTYTADTMTLNIDSGEFFIKDKNSLWDGTSLYKLYEEAHTPWEWHKPIFDRCKEKGIMGFSTPFDFTAVDFLESLNVPLYKIASFENTDIPLIRKVARTGKPIIISNGMATVAEMDEAIRAIREEENNNIILLKCTSTYPASPKDSNLLTIPHMKQLFNCEVGLSDHTLGIGVPVASVALGASVIEKHFTLSRDEGGVDSAFSLEPIEMKMLVEESKRAWEALGNVSYGLAEKEKGSLKFRRSLYITKDLNEGDILTENNVRSIRPGFGLPPRYIDQIIGKKIKKAVICGTPVSWELL